MRVAEIDAKMRNFNVIRLHRVSAALRLLRRKKRPKLPKKPGLLRLQRGSSASCNTNREP